ncbi:uncharacterized protein C7orf50 homolog isoform X2 [Canis lupus familiaris]|uniref:uncharacterized protein C7orf50 homolog isoform X2 n=1 Tax=Canis lupus familiaris TaxID=9615 RepID=UPI000BAA1801|nr:uncharacterized protein C7orf50 homolog isoform X2 [Canis lupus familiaris]|eukprot:XP_022275526.1 uncharacterized protein C7orf50 homolog isoform X2 [Canis lupus familiaris]
MTRCRDKRMAKQKRKVTEMTEKKNKKLKKASAKEILMVPEVTLGTKEVHPEDRPGIRLHPSNSSSLKTEEGGAVLGAGQETAPQLPVLTPEEKRVLERKQKKERRKEEKKRLRESGAAQSPPAKRSGAQLALDYLRGWAEKHDNWRFQKTRQTWLLLHMYDSNQVPDELFSTLLAYLEGLQGRARELTVQKAEALMQKLDEAGGMDPLPQGKTQRIRQVASGDR